MREHVERGEGLVVRIGRSSSDHVCTRSCLQECSVAVVFLSRLRCTCNTPVGTALNLLPAKNLR